MFLVVEFGECSDDGYRGGFAIIRDEWMPPGKKECFFPPFKQSKLYYKSLMRNEQQPPDDRWNLYPVENVVYSTDSILKAIQKVREVQSKSEVLVMTEIDDSGKLHRKRKSSRKVTFAESSEVPDCDSQLNKSLTELCNIDAALIEDDDSILKAIQNIIEAESISEIPVLTKIDDSGKLHRKRKSSRKVTFAESCDDDRRECNVKNSNLPKPPQKYAEMTPDDSRLKEIKKILEAEFKSEVVLLTEADDSRKRKSSRKVTFAESCDDDRRECNVKNSNLPKPPQKYAEMTLSQDDAITILVILTRFERRLIAITKHQLKMLRKQCPSEDIPDIPIAKDIPDIVTLPCTDEELDILMKWLEADEGNALLECPEELLPEKRKPEWWPNKMNQLTGNRRT